MSVVYLWRHRRRYPLLTPSWFKNWAKRLLTGSTLVRSFMLQRSIVTAGGAVGGLSFIAPCVFNGSKCRLKIGSNSYIGRVSLHLHANIDIGDNVVINDGVVLLTASHRTDTSEWQSFSKPINIENYAWVAINAIILPGVTIGKGSVVAAGAVVCKDVKAYTVVAGNPARPVGKDRPLDLSYNPVKGLSLFEAWFGH